MIPAFIANAALKKMKREDENRVGAEVGYGHTYDHVDADDDDEVVLETKGSSPPPQPTPMEEAMAQAELRRVEDEIAAARAERERKASEQTRQDNIARAAPRQRQAYDDAVGFWDEMTGARGYDSNLLDRYHAGDLYRSALDAQRGAFNPEDAQAQFNTRTAMSDAIDAATGGYRADMRRGVNNAAGDGFEYGMFADTADDAIINEILGEKRADAMSGIDAAKARGQLNDAGYTRALGSLSDQGDSAYSQLQGIGQGVLSGYRKRLTDYRDNRLDRIGQMTFEDSPFNMDNFNTRLGDMAGGMRNTLRGDIFSAIGNQSFFDPSSAISGAGSLQGYYNPTASVQRKAAGVRNPLLDQFTNGGSSGSNGVF